MSHGPDSPDQSNPAAHQAPSRRELLRFGMAATGGLAMATGMSQPAHAATSPARIQPSGRAAPHAVVFIFLDGGLSHLDSFDPKPDAPSEIRGPFGAIKTTADGLQVGALWPRVASVADKIAFIRSVTHDQAAHERASRLMLTGRQTPPETALPPIHLQNEPDGLLELYGRSSFGRRMLLARQLVEAGARAVTITWSGWDMHADIYPRMQVMAPIVDQGFAALVRDLAWRGLLDTTRVVLATEFGRSPRINRDRGRDHWPGVFSVAMAGGGIQGGQALGSSDAHGREPRDDAFSSTTLADMLQTGSGIRM